MIDRSIEQAASDRLDIAGEYWSEAWGAFSSVSWFRPITKIRRLIKFLQAEAWFEAEIEAYDNIVQQRYEAEISRISLRRE